MPNILIGALGDHPAVITGAVQALANGQPPLTPVQIDKVRILYPESRTAYLAQKGVAMIRERLFPAPVFDAELPFADADSAERSVAFLRSVHRILDEYEDASDDVYLLLAGGRKNMAALLALAAPFYANVRGLFHLLDRREGTSADVFQSLERLLTSASNVEAEVRASLDQPLDALNLFEVPHPAGAFADAALLKDAVRRMNAGEEPKRLPRPISQEAALFYAAVQEPQAAQKGLEVWLSERAVMQHQEIASRDPALAERLLSVMAQMTNGALLQRQSTQPQNALFRFFHPLGAEMHPVFVTKDTHISYYPKGRFDKAVVCALARPLESGGWEPTAAKIRQALDEKPVKRLAELRPNERTLIVPLGKAPMVASQTYQLLTESETEGRPTIPTVALVYAADDPAVRGGVRLLVHAFEARFGGAVEVRCCEVKGRADLDSTQACRDYYDTLRRAIRDLRADDPHRRIDLSLSGGRKGMSALALFAAQAEGVDRVYHTLITDPDLEQRVEEDTDWAALRSADRADRVRRLFLDAYAAQRDKFVLFPIPVIPLAAPAANPAPAAP